MIKLLNWFIRVIIFNKTMTYKVKFVKKIYIVDYGVKNVKIIIMNDFYF